MRVGDRRRAAGFGSRGRACCFDFRDSGFTLCCGGRGSCFGLGARGFFGAKRFDTGRLDARGFRGDCFLLRRECSGGFCRSGNGGRLLFRSGLDVRCLAATTYWLGAGHGRRFGDGLRHGNAAATTCDRRRRRLLLSACALLALPAGPNSCNLVVGEHAHVAANGNVHLPKKREHFFGRHRKFAGQLVD
jgi:hypothetical protein